MVQYLLVLDRG